MTITNEANRLRLKSRPGIIFEFDPPRWDYEEAEDTIGRVYIENGLKVYKLPGDLPENADYNTIEPGEINPDGTVQQWYYTRTSDPDAETMQNHNRKLAERLEAEGYYDDRPAVPVKKPRRFDSRFWNRYIGPILLTLSILFVGAWLTSQRSDPKQVTVKVSVKPEVSFQYTMTGIQLERQLTASNVTLNLEADGEVTGTVQVPDAKAVGNVRLFNSDLTPIYLPVGTVIATLNGINYKLVQNVSVPAANLNSGKFGLADVQLQADQAGPGGNIPGGVGSYALRNGLKVVGLGAITGGTTRTLKVVTAEDIAQVKTKLQAQATQLATDSFEKQLTVGQKRWGEVILDQPEFSNLPEPGSEQPSGQFKSKLVTQVRGNSYNPDTLLTLAVNQTQPTSDRLPVEYGLPQWKSFTKEANGSYTLSYTRSVQTRVLSKQLTNWQGSRAELEKLLDKLKAKPGLSGVKLVGDLPQDLAGQLVADFQFS